MSATAKKTKRAAIPEAVALRQLERVVAKLDTEAARGAVRDGFGDSLESVTHPLNLTKVSLEGVDPQVALVYLSFAVEALAKLVVQVRGTVESATRPDGRASTPTTRSADRGTLPAWQTSRSAALAGRRGRA